MACLVSELLKAHRQDYLYREYDMMQVPLKTELEEKFGAQVMCTYVCNNERPLIIHLPSSVLILWRSKMSFCSCMNCESVYHVRPSVNPCLSGEICAELQSVTCNVQLEYSYLVHLHSIYIPDWILIEIGQHLGRHRVVDPRHGIRAARR